MQGSEFTFSTVQKGGKYDRLGIIVFIVDLRDETDFERFILCLIVYSILPNNLCHFASFVFSRTLQALKIES